MPVKRRAKRTGASRDAWARSRQIQCEDVEDYKRVMKGTLKALLEGPTARDALSGQSEFVVLLVRPPGSDPLAKAPRKVRPSALGPWFGHMRWARAIRVVADAPRMPVRV